MTTRQRPRRLPKTTRVDVLDEDFEKLLVDAVEKLVKAANPRRVRRIDGLLLDFRDEPGSLPALYEYYKRVVGEAFLDAIGQR